MADSLVSGLSAGEQSMVQGAMLAGMHYGAMLKQHQIQQAAENQREQMRVAAENQRQQQNFQQQWSMEAMRLAAQAEHIRQQDSRTYYSSKLNEYNKYLADGENYWKDVTKNPWKYDQQSVQGAAQNLQWIGKKRTEIAGIDPNSADRMAGIPQLNEQAPFTGTPSFSPTYTKQLQAESDEKQQQFTNSKLTGQKLQWELDHPTTPAESPDQKAQRKALDEWNKTQDHFQGVVQSTNAARNRFAQGIQQFGSQANWANSDPKGFANAQNAKIKAEAAYTAVAPAFFRQASDEELTSPGLSELVTHLQSTYGDLTDFNNLTKATQDLSNKDYSGEGGHDAWKVVNDFFGATTGVRKDDYQPPPPPAVNPVPTASDAGTDNSGDQQQ